MDERKGDVKHSKANIEKIKLFLGYEPTIKFENGLKIVEKYFSCENAKKILFNIK